MSNNNILRKSTDLPVIGIIILHFGKWDVTKECLDSLLNLKKGNFSIKTIVVDNSLNTNLQCTIKNHKAVSKLVVPEKNLGFAGGNNLGIKVCRELGCSHVMFLNNDTVVEPGFIAPLLETIYNESIGISGPVLEHKVKGKTYYDYGGYIDWKKGQPRHENKTVYDKNIKTFKRDFISGCCMLTRIDLLEKIGSFNESYFLYLEDVELCLRFAKAGYAIVLVPQSKIFHKGSQSATELTKILYSWRNSIKLTLSYVPLKYRFSALIFNLIFYPALYFRWQLSRLKSSLFPSFIQI